MLRYVTLRFGFGQHRVSGADGRRRFDPDGKNAYAYVNVLLYTQQLGEAVAFLHWKGQHVAVRYFDFDGVSSLLFPVLSAPFKLVRVKRLLRNRNEWRLLGTVNE